MNKHKMMIQVDGETYYHTDHVAKLTGIAHDHGYKTGKDDGYEAAIEFYCIEPSSPSKPIAEEPEIDPDKVIWTDPRKHKGM